MRKWVKCKLSYTSYKLNRSLFVRNSHWSAVVEERTMRHSSQCSSSIVSEIIRSPWRYLTSIYFEVFFLLTKDCKHMAKSLQPRNTAQKAGRLQGQTLVLFSLPTLSHALPFKKENPMPIVPRGKVSLGCSELPRQSRRLPTTTEASSAIFQTPTCTSPTRLTCCHAFELWPGERMREAHQEAQVRPDLGDFKETFTSWDLQFSQLVGFLPCFRTHLAGSFELPNQSASVCSSPAQVSFCPSSLFATLTSSRNYFLGHPPSSLPQTSQTTHTFSFC